MSKVLSLEEVKKYTYIDFKVEKESWARYKVIEDGTIIKIKNVLVNAKTDTNLTEILKKTRELQEKKPIAMSIQIHNVIGIETQPKIRGLPDEKKYSPTELSESIINDDLDFERADSTTWVSIYELDGGIKLKVQSTLNDVSKTNKYDSSGDPIYLVSSSADVKISMPKKYMHTPQIKSTIQ